MPTAIHTSKRRRVAFQDDGSSDGSTASDQTPPEEIILQDATPEQPPASDMTIGDTEISPTAAAKAIVSKLVLSLPEFAKTFILAASTKHNRLKSQERQQLATTVRFADEDFIPRSTRFKFEIKCSDGVKESENFKTLQADAAAALALCEKSLKAVMLTSVTHELELTRKKMTNAFCKSVLELVSLFYLIRHPSTLPAAIPGHALSRFVINALPEPFFVHLPFDTSNVQKIYSDHAQDDVAFDPEAATPANQLTPFHAVAVSVLPILVGIFKDSWEAQVKNYLAKAALVATEKLLRDFAVGAATEAASMEIDTNPTADPKLLKDLIASEVSAQTKKLRKELDRYKQQDRRADDPAAKNKSRGDATPRAPSTKKRKQAKKKPPSTPKVNPKKGRTDGADSGTSEQKGNGNRSRKPKKKKPTPKTAPKQGRR